MEKMNMFYGLANILSDYAPVLRQAYTLKCNLGYLWIEKVEEAEGESVYRLSITDDNSRLVRNIIGTKNIIDNECYDIIVDHVYSMKQKMRCLKMEEEEKRFRKENRLLFRPLKSNFVYQG